MPLVDGMRYRGDAASFTLPSYVASAWILYPLAQITNIRHRRGYRTKEEEDEGGGGGYSFAGVDLVEFSISYSHPDTKKSDL